MITEMINQEKADLFRTDSGVSVKIQKQVVKFMISVKDFFHRQTKIPVNGAVNVKKAVNQGGNGWNINIFYKNLL